MPAKREKKVTWVEPPKMGIAEALYLPAIAEGLSTTFKHMFQPRKTKQYPEETPTLPPNYRGVHRLNRDEKGRVKCVACFLCATACPANCIDIVAAAAPKDDTNWVDRDKYPAKFVIDELRCIYCGMCEEACPVDAIELTSIYNMTGQSRDGMLFDREKLLGVFDETSKRPSDPVRTHRGVLGPASEIVAGTQKSAAPMSNVAEKAGP